MCVLVPLVAINPLKRPHRGEQQPGTLAAASSSCPSLGDDTWKKVIVLRGGSSEFSDCFSFWALNIPN